MEQVLKSDKPSLYEIAEGTKLSFDTKEEAIKYYKKVVNELSEKYGKTPSEMMTFVESYGEYKEDFSLYLSVTRKLGILEKSL